MLETNFCFFCIVKPWERLLRKLRCCLLIALRLDGKPIGALPISISNIEAGCFSIYEWISRDLISFSHDQLEIVALETACKNSEKSFYPSSEKGDVAKHWRMVQECCEMNSSQYHMNQSESEPLLFFFNHFNNSIKLSAHRALLLGQEWGRNVSTLF